MFLYYGVSRGIFTFLCGIFRCFLASACILSALSLNKGFLIIIIIIIIIITTMSQ